MIDPMDGELINRGARQALEHLQNDLKGERDPIVRDGAMAYIEAAFERLRLAEEEVKVSDAALTRLARLERLVRKGLASDEEIAEYKRLDAEMPASADVERALRVMGDW